MRWSSDDVILASLATSGRPGRSDYAGKMHLDVSAVGPGFALMIGVDHSETETAGRFSSCRILERAGKWPKMPRFRPKTDQTQAKPGHGRCGNN